MYRLPLRNCLGLVLRLCLCTIVAGAIGRPSGSHAQDCDRYLNASDGDDANTGAAPQDAVRSFEHAFLSFPAGSVVCITAGEYVHGADADGIQLSGSGALDKSMRFVLRSFGESTEVAFTEDEFRVDIGNGTLTFESGTGQSVRLGVGLVNLPSAFPDNTTFLHTLALLSGTVDARSVGVTLGPSVGNPAFTRETKIAPSSAAILRGTGRLLANAPFPSDDTAARRLVYTASGDRTAGAETPPIVRHLGFEHSAGTVTVDRDAAFAPDASIELSAAGSAVILVPLTLGNLSSTAISVTGPGRLELNGVVELGLAAAVDAIVSVTSNGSLSITSALISAVSSLEEARFVNAGSGTLEIESAAVQSGALRLLNDGNGQMSLGSGGSASAIEASVSNGTEGTINVAGDLTIFGSMDNAGTLRVDGVALITGSFSNQSEVSLSADLEAAGPFSNSGSILLRSNTLTLSGSGTVVNSGTIDGTQAGLGWLALAGDLALTGGGRFTNLRSVSASQEIVIEEIDGDVHAVAGSLSFTGLHQIGGSIVADGGEIHLPGVIVSGDVVSNGGLIRLHGATEVEGDVHQDGAGEIDLNGQSLSLGGDLLRNAGTLVADQAVLTLTGTSQRITGGPSAVFGRLHVTSGAASLDAYPLTVRTTLSVGASSQLLLGDQNITLSEPNAQVVNDGSIQSGMSGALIFGAAPQSLTGSGSFGSIEIAAGEKGVVSVVDAAVRQSGTLTLAGGQFRIDSGSSYTLEEASLLRRNLGDADGSGEPDAKEILANTPSYGTFTVPESGYSLEYYGTFDGRAEIGAEFLSENVADLSVLIDGSDTGSAVLVLPSDRGISGDLEVGAGAVLDVGGHELVAADAGGDHLIAGEITAGGGSFVVTGGTIRGDQNEAASIENLTVRSNGDVRITDLRSIGGILRVEGGNAVLQLSQDEEAGSLGAGNVGDVRLVGSAVLSLSSSVQVVRAFVGEGGAVVLNTNDIVIGDEGVFQLDGQVTLQGDGGRVIFPGSGTVATGQTAIPRLVLSAEPDERLRLLDRTVVRESFVHDGGILDMGAFDFVHAGRLWEYAAGSYEGAGSFVISGNVAGEFAAGAAIPNLTISGLADQTTFTVRSDGNLPISVRIEETLRLSGGTVDLGPHDVVVEGTFHYEAGSIQMDSDGELVLDGTRVDLEVPLSLANLRVASAGEMADGSGPLTVIRRVSFESGSLSGVKPSNFRLPTGTRVVRYGAGTFHGTPSFGQVVDLEYDFRAAADSSSLFATGDELSPNHVGRMVVEAGAASLELASRTRILDGLYFRSGTLRPRENLIIEDGAAVFIQRRQIPPPVFEGGSYSTAGPITLVFESTIGDVTSSDLTFPADAEVDTLVVRMGDESGDLDYAFTLHAIRRIGSLILENRSPGSSMNLNGQTLVVGNVADLRQGVLTSREEALLELQGDLTTHPLTRIDGVVSISVQGDASIAGIFNAFELKAFGDVEVTGRLGGPGVAPTAGSDLYEPDLPNLTFAGVEQLLRFGGSDEDRSSVDDAVNRLTLELADSAGVVYLQSGEETPYTLAVNHLVLEHGVLSTGPNELRLPHNGLGFEHADDAVSYVAGRVSRRIEAGQPNPFTEPFARFEFPLGTDGPDRYYRPIILTLSADYPATAGTVVTVEHAGRRPDGYRGLPIDGGVDLLIDDVGSLFWEIEANPPLPNPLRADLAAIATGFDEFAAARHMRFLSRTAGAGPESHWSLVATPLSYDNALVSFGLRSAPFIQALGTSVRLDQDARLFAPGVQAAAVDYARLQLVNLLDRDVDLVVDGGRFFTEVESGQATPFVRIDAAPSSVSLQINSREVLRDSAQFQPQRDYLFVAAAGETATERRLMQTDVASATPELEHKDAISLAFFNALPGAGSLTLTSRDDNRALFAAVPYGTLSASYVALPAEEAGFNVTGTGDQVVAARAGLQNALGLTVTAIVSPGFGEPTHRAGLTLVTSEGDVVPSTVQVGSEESVELPEAFAVQGNYPNPFNPATYVTFDLPGPADVRIEVFDMLGRNVLSLPPTTVPAGIGRSIEVDAGRLASGVYVYRVIAETGTRSLSGTGRMTLVK